MSLLRGVVLPAVAVVAAIVSSYGQAPPSSMYVNGKPPFPNPVSPFLSTSVAKPDFSNSTRLGEVLKDGKLMLSLDDALALALENNLDLAIARYNLPIADTDMLRAKAGSGVRGVATGIVQGTPGGGMGILNLTGTQGGGAGGTTSAAGGAGAGTSGIVTSTLGIGPPLDSYDPVLSSGLSIEHATTPEAMPLLFGTPFLQSNLGTANFQYSQAFPTGSQLTVDFNNFRNTTNNILNVFNPIISSSYRITLRQHLLEGLSLGSNRRNLIIAKNNREISDVAFRQQVITTVAQIENIYWDLVNAYEDVQVKQHSLALAERLLSDNQKQVQIGTLAPIEVVRAQSAVASSQQDLIVSQTNLQLQQLLTKNAISRNLTDPQLAAAEVVPTDTMKIPPVEPVVPTQDLVADALSHRPELAQAHIDLTNREITKKAAKNALLPTVDLVSWYGTSALAGPLAPAAVAGGICPPNLGFTLTGALCVPAGLHSTGYNNAFTTLFGNNYPDYAVGLNVNIPIRNRPAQADQIRSELEYRQAQIRLQQLQNQIRIQVRNAQFAVQQNRARVDAARKARDLAQETLSAEQKKYALGASTTYNVLAAQRDLSQAESNVVSAMTAYAKSKVDLDSSTGLTLAHLGIELSDAESGNVNHLPNVPDAMPAASVVPNPDPPNANPPDVQMAPQPGP